MTRLRARLGHEGGATLVEMLVIVILMGVVGSIVTNSLVLAMRTTMRSQDRSYSLAELQKGAERLSREIRSGTPVALSASTATLDVIRNGQRHRLTYTITAGGVLQQTKQIWNSSASNPSLIAANSTVTTPVVTDLVVAAPFTYFDREGTAIATPAAPYSTVDRVVVTLQRQLDGQPAIRIDSGVELRNTHLNET